MTESTEKKSTGKEHASARIGVKQAASQLVLTLTPDPDVEFYPHALDLDEGISCNPRAELRAYSTACLSKKQIDELMGIDATLEIHQQLEVPSGSSKEAGTYRKVTREFSGIVTEVRHLGRKSDPLAAGTAVYAYDFVIEGELCRLKRSVHTRTFLSKGGDSANVGLKCVLEKILEGTDLVLVFPKKKEDSSEKEDGSKKESNSEEPSPTPWDETLTFAQTGETDYAFLHRIAEAFRLSFNLVGKRLCFAYNGIPESVDLWATGSEDLPFCVAASKDKTDNKDDGSNDDNKGAAEGKEEKKNNKNRTLRFTCGGSSHEKLALSSWEGIRRERFSSVSVPVAGTKDRGSVSGGKGIGEFDFAVSPFCVSPRDKNEAKELAARFLDAMNQKASLWEGKVAYLCAVPGMKASVSDFYSETEDSEAALIFSTRLHVVVPWNSGFARPRDLPATALFVQMMCMETKDNAVFTDVSMPAAPASAENVPAAPANVLSVAEVWESESKSGEKEKPTTLYFSSDGKFYVFYAKRLEDKESTLAVQVRMTMPVGGYNQGLFRVPRVGEKILIASERGGIADRFYLVAYLPRDEDKDKFLEMNSVTSSPSPEATGSEGEEKSSPDTKENTGPETTDSEDEKTSSSSSATKEDLGSLVLRHRTPGEEKYSEIRMMSEETEKTESETIKKQERIKIETTGDLIAKASENASLAAKNFFFECNCKDGDEKNGNIVMKKFRQLIVDAEEGIELRVGSNSICITETSIALRSALPSAKKKNKTGLQADGPMGALVFIDSALGVSLSGIRCSVSGTAGVTLKDAVGAGVSLSAGAATMSGLISKLSTINVVDFGFNMGLFATSFLMQSCADSRENEETRERDEENIYISESVLEGVAEVKDIVCKVKDIVCEMIKDHKKEEKDSSKLKSTTEIISVVLEFVILIIDLVYIGCSTKGEKGVKGLAIAATTFKLTALATATTAVMAEAVKEGLSAVKDSEFKLTAGDATLEGVNIEKVSLKKFSGQTFWLEDL